MDPVEIEDLQEEHQRLIDEVFDLRRRLESTEDALLRANRKLIKPIPVSCQECGRSWSVAWPEEQKK